MLWEWILDGSVSRIDSISILVCYLHPHFLSIPSHQYLNVIKSFWKCDGKQKGLDGQQETSLDGLKLHALKQWWTQEMATACTLCPSHYLHQWLHWGYPNIFNQFQDAFLLTLPTPPTFLTSLKWGFYNPWCHILIGSILKNVLVAPKIMAS